MSDRLRMRKIIPLVAALAAATAVLVQAADANKERGRAAANQVRDKIGSAESFNSNVMQPMTADQPLYSIDGSRSVDATIGCEGSQSIVGVTIAPTSTNDLGNLVVQVDSNVDGSVDQVRSFTGPYGGVCANGVVQCAAGTTNGCSYWQWAPQGSGITLKPVSQTELGACYCFNNSCGAGLLTSNMKKIGSDLAMGIGTALLSANPKIALGEAQHVDAVQTYLFGQIANCSTANGPEQYAGNINNAVAAGQAVNSNASSTYGKLLTQKGTAESATCVVQREAVVPIEDADRAIDVVGQTNSTVTSCGLGCWTVTVGRVGSKYLDGGSCNVHVDSVSLRINNPDAIQSAVLTQVSYDDHLHFSVKGSLVFRDAQASDWDGASATCGENGRRGTYDVSQDFTSILKGAAAGETVVLRAAVGWKDLGAGWATMTIRAEPFCGTVSDNVVNGCTAFENNSDCRIDSETVDGVKTVENFYPTNLPVPPSSKTITSGECSVPMVRPFWLKTRRYQCRADAPDYDYSTAVNRYNMIHETFDVNTGDYTDRQKTANGFTSVPSSVPLPEPDPVLPCTPTCKTRKPRPGSEMGGAGAASKLNSTGVAWDYTYKECPAANVCPITPGEEVMAACECRSSFSEAAALMQTIRQVGQDAVCTAN